MRSLIVLVVDTCTIRDIVDRKVHAVQELIDLAARCAGGRKRCRTILFTDELQTQLLGEFEKLIKRYISVIKLFAFDLSVISYERSKRKLHGGCEKLNDVRRALGLRPSEDCSKELESDAFLLVAACAYARGADRVIVVTSEAEARARLGDAVEKTSLSGRVEVRSL